MADFREPFTKPAAPTFAGRASDSVFRARVVSGSDQGRVVDLDGTLPSRIYIGQGPSCEVRLADLRVSRRHASLDLCGGHLVLTDAGSRNGTYVNGVLVMQAKLTGGEVMKVGDTAIAIELVESVRGTPPASFERFGRVIGASVEMRRLFSVLERLASSNSPVLIEGEPGSGKDLVAEALHERSARASQPFVVVDVASAPDLDAAYAQAGNGTLVLDELGAAGYAVQTALAKLLRRATANGARIIALSQRDLEPDVQAGRFREDVLQKFDDGRVEIPPLRRRDGDVRFLAQQLWANLGGAPETFPFELLEQRATYAWPGNVSELETVLAQRLAGAPRPHPSAPDREPHAARPVDAIDATLALDLPLVSARERVVQEFERRYLERALIKHGGNVLRAAAASGVARRYFQLLRAKRMR
jgi:two-component system response regulator HydG